MIDRFPVIEILFSSLTHVYITIHALTKVTQQVGLLVRENLILIRTFSLKIAQIFFQNWAHLNSVRIIVHAHLLLNQSSLQKEQLQIFVLQVVGLNFQSLLLGGQLFTHVLNSDWHRN